MKKAIIAVVVSAALIFGGAPLAEAHSRPRTAAARTTRTRTAPSIQTWERLAQCESGGRWDYNGRTYDGGLQFDRQTWRSVGGSGTANNAPKAEQIQRATTLHAKRGFSPWPGCSRKLGLR